MSDNIIKEIISTQAGEENNENPQYDTFQIGADAQNIDFPNGQNLLEIIGNIAENEHISSGLLDRVFTNEKWIEILKQYYNDLNLSTEGLVNSDAIQDENINNLQLELNTLSTEIAKITTPYLVDKIIWDTANQRTLRAILGNLQNMPYNSVRSWLQALTSNLNKFNSLIWHSLGENQEEETNQKEETNLEESQEEETILS